MIRLNGDIIKYLNNIYGISFKKKYTNELKDRIVFFVKNYIENSYLEETFLNKSSILSKEILFENNEIKILFKPFFNINKEALLNSFSPIWYSSKTVKKIYSKKELLYLLNVFILLEQDNLTKDIFIKKNFTFDFYNVKYILTCLNFKGEIEQPDFLDFDKNTLTQILSILDNSFLYLFHYYFEFFSDIKDLYQKETIFIKTISFIETKEFNLKDFLYSSFQTYDYEEIYAAEQFHEFAIDRVFINFTTEKLVIGMYYFLKARELILLKLNQD